MNNVEYRINSFGDASVIKQQQTTIKSPGTGEVQLRIQATGLSMADVLIRRGVYLDIRKPHVITGYEAIAVIEAMGTGVSKSHPSLTIGTQVALMTLTGNNAHYRNVSANEVVILPEQLPPALMPEAAALMLNYVTAYQMIHRQKLTWATKSKPQRILIHSAAGGVGSALIQLLKPLDVQLWGTASPHNHQRLLEQSVVAIDYHTQNVAHVCQQAGGMDIVFDGIGGRHLAESKRCLTPTGQLIFYGMTELITGNQPSKLQFSNYIIRTAWYLLKSKLTKNIRFYSITDTRKKHPDWFVEDFNKVFELYRTGVIKPELAPVLPMSKITEAHHKMEMGEIQGKQILVPDPLWE